MRLRALSKLEEQERCVWKVDGRCVIHTEGDNRRDADCRRDTDARRSSTYAADYVFGPESTNEQVHREAVEALVHDAVEGKSVTIMVYGQTGSGKTHTMGTPSNPGIIQRGLVDIFELITEKEDRDFLLRFSFLEVRFTMRRSSLVAMASAHLLGAILSETTVFCSPSQMNAGPPIVICPSLSRISHPLGSTRAS